MWTLQKLKDDRHTVRIYCNATGCHHHRLLDLDKAGEVLGMDHSGMAPDLLPKFKCSECGSKNLSMTIAPPTPQRGAS